MDLRIGNLLLVLLTCVCGHGDRDFQMCGSWRHSEGSRTLHVDLNSGGTEIIISANSSTLSVRGSITNQCKTDQVRFLRSSTSSSSLCVFWEPLLDQLTVNLSGEIFSFCNATGLQTTCCTHLSPDKQSQPQTFGIIEGSIQGDIMSNHVIGEYTFKGERINCKDYFCGKAAQESRGANMIEEAVMRSGAVGDVYLPCVRSTVIEMKEDFPGQNITLLAPKSNPQARVPSVHLPACLKPPHSKTSKVVCTYYNNSTFFQKSSGRILEDVIGISVENEIITNLPEPVRIRFSHPELMQNTHSRTCVSWDTRKDNQVVWRDSGCETLRLSAVETECCCNHLTYFAVLVDLNPTRNLRHLEALTFITAVCCAVSIVSCAVLFISLCRQRKLKNQSSLVHRGLVVALFFLLVLFIISGTVANVASEGVCRFFGGLLHYALLSVFCWMAVEVIHTFWMMYMVFKPSPNPWVWYLLGFGVPALPVIILGLLGDVYGQKKVKSADASTTPYSMCWMKDSRSALMAHFIINMGLLVAVVSSGLVMLFLVFQKIHNRDEWRRNRVAFLSIWGLSCLFGSTWALAFFSFEASEAVLFLFCIINSLQGFFLMLRFFALERIQKTSQSSSEYSSTGSTRQNMLQSQEKN